MNVSEPKPVAETSDADFIRQMRSMGNALLNAKPTPDQINAKLIENESKSLYQHPRN